MCVCVCGWVCVCAGWWGLHIALLEAGSLSLVLYCCQTVVWASGRRGVYARVVCVCVGVCVCVCVCVC